MKVWTQKKKTKRNPAVVKPVTGRPWEISKTSSKAKRGKTMVQFSLTPISMAICHPNWSEILRHLYVASSLVLWTE